jgi:hypothetical protein
LGSLVPFGGGLFRTTPPEWQKLPDSPERMDLLEPMDLLESAKKPLVLGTKQMQQKTAKCCKLWIEMASKKTCSYGFLVASSKGTEGTFQSTPP